MTISSKQLAALGYRVAGGSVRWPLVLPYPPGVNHLYATVRGRRVLSREGRAFKAAAAALALAAGVRPVVGDVVVSVDVYRPRRAADLDGRLKATLDALTGIAYADDGQVVEIHARRFEDKARPRVEVTIETRADA